MHRRPQVCQFQFVSTRDLKVQRRGRQRERQQNNRFNKRNNNFARAPHCFVHFFPVLHDYDVKMPYFAFYGGRKQATTKFYSSF